MFMKIVFGFNVKNGVNSNEEFYVIILFTV